MSVKSGFPVNNKTKRWVFIGNQLITLLLFGLILLILGGYFLIEQRIFSSGVPVEKLFQEIIDDAGHEDWVKAARKAEQLQRVWEQRKYLIWFNYAETDYHILEEAVSSLSAAIQTEQKYETISWAKTGRRLWLNFLKPVPEP